MCSLDGNLYEMSYAGSWSQTTVGAPTTPTESCLHATIGDVRGDGRSRLYAVRGPYAIEYTWNGTSFDQYYIGSVRTGLAHGIFLGNGRGGTTNRLYIASTASGTYEASFSGGTWSALTSMGDDGDIRNVVLGVGRNDGVIRAYAATACACRSARTAGEPPQSMRPPAARRWRHSTRRRHGAGHHDHGRLRVP